MHGIDRTAAFRLLTEALKSLHNAISAEQEQAVLERLKVDLEDALGGVPPLRRAA